MPRLPVYKLRRVVVVINDAKARRMWEVTCPNSDCRSVFYVGLTWKKARTEELPGGTAVTYKRRACPFCFKAAEVP